jgi:hypothetical protein
MVDDWTGEIIFKDSEEIPNYTCNQWRNNYLREYTK